MQIDIKNPADDQLHKESLAEDYRPRLNSTPTAIKFVSKWLVLDHGDERAMLTINISRHLHHLRKLHTLLRRRL